MATCALNASDYFDAMTQYDAYPYLIRIHQMIVMGSRNDATDYAKYCLKADMYDRTPSQLRWCVFLFGCLHL